MISEELKQLRDHIESGTTEDQLGEMSRWDLEDYALDVTIKFLDISERLAAALVKRGGQWH